MNVQRNGLKVLHNISINKKMKRKKTIKKNIYGKMTDDTKQTKRI